MKQSLSNYMERNLTKQELLDALQPPTRTIHIKVFQNSVIDTIESILSLARNSIEHHQQSIKVVLEGTMKPLVFPSRNDATSTKKIAILLTLLRAIFKGLQEKEIRTIRDVYYSNVELYGDQKKVDYWLSTIAMSFKLPSKEYLNIVPAQKGLCFTPLQIDIDTGGTKSFIAKDTSSLIPYIKQDSKLTVAGHESTRLNLIVLEKEAIYNKLIENSSSHYLFKDTIIITGKGYPDFLTRLFLNKLQPFANCIQSWNIFTDADPHGIDIALKYIQNDINPCYKCERLQYKGARISQLLNYKSVQFLKLSQRDVSLAIKLLLKLTNEPIPQIVNKPFVTELQRQLFFYKKAEMNGMGKDHFFSSPSLSTTILNASL